MTSRHTVIARNRFGLGARPDDTNLNDPQGWLVAQLKPQSALAPSLADLPDTVDAISSTRQIVQARRQAQLAGATAAKETSTVTPSTGSSTTETTSTDAIASATAVKPQKRMARDAEGDTLAGLYAQQVMARVAAAINTTTPFRERLVHFWSNHFAISTEKANVKALAGPFEIEAIRANLDGSFAQMLTAVVQHPAMLFYLDNSTSFGPDSMLVKRRQGTATRTLGLNENLAREILELYSLGVRTGFTQADVTELARAITGWSVQSDRPQLARFGQPGADGFVFYERTHQPGRRIVLGKSYAEGGQAQGLAILRDLGTHPATAHHVATKLARHFLADDPPASAVEQLERVFLATGGDLPSLHRQLIDLDEIWAPGAAEKFKTPWDYVISVGRLTGLPNLKAGQLAGLFGQLGQPVYAPGSPAGWPDTAAAWLSSDGLSKRVQLATQVAHSRTEPGDSRTLAELAFGETLSSQTRMALTNAESGLQALTLLLAAPEMMRR